MAFGHGTRTLLSLLRPTPTTPFASKPITRLKFQQAPKRKVQNVWRGITLQKSYMILPVFIDRNLDNMYGMWDHGRRNIKLDQAEFVDMGCQFGWLTET